MAGVDHAYQYAVEVKSRFSMFMDDNVGNEDPELLLSKLQSGLKHDRHKKEKTALGTPAQPVGKKADVAPDSEAKTDAPTGKAKVVRMPKLPKSTPAPPAAAEETLHETTAKEVESSAVAPVPRGRGGPRGFGRGFRGRGQGPRPPFRDDAADSSGDLNSQRDAPFEPRGRGRGRPRGFSRGRGAAYTDYREYNHQQGFDRTGPRPPRRDGFETADQPAPDEAVNAVPEGGDAETVEVENDGAANVNQAEEPVDGADEPTEEETKSYTLEEYKALKSGSKPSVTLSSKGNRKANDGKDVFANMVAHRKINEVSDDEVEEVEKEQEEQQSFEINVSFTDRFENRGRGRGFGNRGGGGGGFERGRGSPGFRGAGRPRGRGMRGDGRGRGFSRGMGFDHQTAPPVIHSDQDFPSLK